MKLETVYKRTLDISSMILFGEMAGAEYEIFMQQKNQIPGFLKMEMILSDGIEQYWYDITGKRSLDSYLEAMHLKNQQFMQLMEQILEAQQQLTRYLLREEALLLDPEYIFWDPRKERFFFCYCPAGSEESVRQVRELLEYLLQKLDHKDMEAVQNGYGVYQGMVEENSSLRQVMAQLQRTEKNEQKAEAYAERTSEAESETKEEPEEEKEITEKRRIQTNLFQRMKEPFETMRKKKKVGTELVFEPDQIEEDTEPENPTIYLQASDAGRQTQGILKYMGNGREEDFNINREVFVIGSKREGIDGVLYEDTISRIHAQISHQEGEYYLEDLNSMNGTMLNGKLLDYKEKVKLHPGDEVCFASERYEFY